MKTSPAPADRKPAPSLLDRLRSIINPSAEPTVVDLERAASDAAQARDAALAHRAQLEGQRADMALAPDVERAAYRARLAEAIDQAETFAVVAERIGGRLAEARAAEEQARRRAIYVEAQKASADYARTFSRDYLVAATALLALLRDGARIAMAVERANEALPAGAAPLAHPEILARGASGSPAEIVKVEDVTLWARADDPTRPADNQLRIDKVGNGWGRLRRDDPRRLGWAVGDLGAAYRRGVFRKTTTREAVAATFPGFLAGTLQLPAPAGAPGPGTMLWDAAPWLDGDPGATLARVAAADVLLQSAGPVERATRVTYEMVSVDPPDDAVPARPDPEVRERSRVVQSTYLERDAQMMSGGR